MPSLFQSIASFPVRFLNVLQEIKDELNAIHTTYKSTQEQQNREPIIVQATLSQPEGDSKENQRHHGEVETFQNRYIFIQAVALFITAIIAVATLFSAKAAKDAAFASRQQVEATNANIEITRKSIDATVQSFQRDQRAWVEAIHPAMSTRVGDKLEVGVIIKNSGKTPAFDVDEQIFTLFSRREIPDVDGWMNSNKPPWKHLRLGVLFPDSEYFANSGDFNITINPFMQGQLKTRQVIPYTIGRITYNDVFGNMHTTRFCYVWYAALSVFDTCTTYNHAD